MKEEKGTGREEAGTMSRCPFGAGSMLELGQQRDHM